MTVPHIPFNTQDAEGADVERLLRALQRNAAEDAPAPRVVSAMRLFRAHDPGVRQAMLDAATTALDLTGDEVQTQLRSGQTVAQLAQAQGTTEKAVTDAALAAAKTQLAQAVTDGTVTQAQADAAYAQLEAKGANRLVGGGRGGGKHNKHGFGGDGEMQPSSPEASPSASTTPDA